MIRRGKLLLAAVFACALGTFVYAAYFHWHASHAVPAAELIKTLPPGSSTLVYADLAALRQAGFLTLLKNLAPDAQKEPDYAQFVRDTGFDFERDLDRLALAEVAHGDTRTFYAAAEGRFDQQKIRALALRSGKLESRAGREIFSLPLSGSPAPMLFSFLPGHRILLTTASDPDFLLRPRAPDASAAERDERVLRLAGSPVFGILHPEPATLRDLSRRIPGGLHSDQLTALAENIRWFTFAVRPDGQGAQIVLEAEAISDSSAAQLDSLAQELLLLARTALELSGGRSHLPPAEHAALLDLLRSVQLDQINRGETQAVRLVLSAGPPVFQALLDSSPLPPAGSPSGKQKLAK